MRITGSHRHGMPLDIVNANSQWALDFMHYGLYHGKRFRTLYILDESTR